MSREIRFTVPLVVTALISLLAAADAAKRPAARWASYAARASAVPSVSNARLTRCIASFALGCLHLSGWTSRLRERNARLTRASSAPSGMRSVA